MCIQSQGQGLDSLCARLRRERAELLLELVEVLNQACFADDDGVLTSCCLSAYAAGIDVLVKYGLAQHIAPPFGRWRKVQLNQQQISKLEAELANTVQEVGDAVARRP